MTGTPPDALDWHPWYRDKTWLLDWLESGDFGPYVVAVPDRQAVHFATYDTAPTKATRDHAVLTKREVVGPAPYVGTPFIYVWRAATDQYGRSIAGESRIVYPSGGPS